MAEVLLNSLGNGRFRAFSAGSRPTGQINQRVVKLLRSMGHDVDHLASKSWEVFERATAPQMDFIFTVCDNAAGEVCPVWPGHPITTHWPFPDPAGLTGSEAAIAVQLADVYRMIARRIDGFVGLPVDSLDRLSLRRALQDLGAKGEDKRQTGSGRGSI